LQARNEAGVNRHPAVAVAASSPPPPSPPLPFRLAAAAAAAAPAADPAPAELLRVKDLTLLFVVFWSEAMARKILAHAMSVASRFRPKNQNQRQAKRRLGFTNTTHTRVTHATKKQKSLENQNKTAGRRRRTSSSTKPLIAVPFMGFCYVGSYRWSSRRST
jgi:hypothetical protein